MTRSLGALVRDNLEAFAIAIAMALVIRHYCVEAFRIPTGSMMPTLYGDRPPEQGDRILVDKFVYQYRDPRRWEVVVFEYPLNRSKNFIKRCVGLGGEQLLIRDGDLWTSDDGGETWRIARKPPGVQEELFFPFWPDPVDGEWRRSPESTWEVEPGWHRGEERDAFSVDAPAARATLRFLPQITGYNPRGRPPEVGDVRVRFRLRVERPGRLAVQITEHGRIHRLVLDRAESAIEIGGVDGARVPIDFRLEKGTSCEIEFANVDDALRVVIDGEALEPVLYDTDRTRPPDDADEMFGDSWGKNGIEIVAIDLAAALDDLAIARDLHYEERGNRAVYDVPEGHFLMFGDNTHHSSDSREWDVVEIELDDGTRVAWSPGEVAPGRHDGRANPATRSLVPPGGPLLVAPDSQGLVRRIDPDRIVAWDDHVDRPFVPRDHLVGRAFAVFWPIYLPPVYRGPTRIQLIR